MTHGTTAPPPADGTPETKRQGWRTWQLAAAGAVALVIGIGVGAAGSGGAADDGAPSSAGETDQLEAEVERLEEELADRDEALAAAVEEAEEAAAEAAEPEQEAEPDEAAEPEPEPDEETAAAGSEGEYTAGDYSFADVQVSEDFIGQFEVRARMTNDGPSQETVGITATIFADGSVVATASGVTSSFESGQTVTLEMLSTDDFTEWDEIEFQVEYEF